MSVIYGVRKAILHPFWKLHLQLKELWISVDFCVILSIVISSCPYYIYSGSNVWLMLFRMDINGT